MLHWPALPTRSYRLRGDTHEIHRWLLAHAPRYHAAFPHPYPRCRDRAGCADGLWRDQAAEHARRHAEPAAADGALFIADARCHWREDHASQGPAAKAAGLRADV